MLKPSDLKVGTILSMPGNGTCEVITLKDDTVTFKVLTGPETGMEQTEPVELWLFRLNYWNAFIVNSDTKPLTKEDLVDGVRLKWPDEKEDFHTYATVQVKGEQVQVLVTRPDGTVYESGFDTFEHYLDHFNKNGVQLVETQHAD